MRRSKRRRLHRLRKRVSDILNAHGCELKRLCECCTQSRTPILRVVLPLVAGYCADRRRVEQCASELEAAGITNFVV